MNMWIKLIVISMLCIPKSLNSQGQVCITPLRDSGICVNLRQCGGLVSLLKTQSNNPEVRNYLLSSTCGYIGDDPLVCCPQFGQIVDSSPATAYPSVSTTNVPVPTTNSPISTSIMTTPISVTITTETEEVSAKSNTHKLLKPPYCGFSNVSDFRIIGGVPARLGQFPWLVALGYKNSNDVDDPKWLCGGSLVTERHVLTAGHCVYKRSDLYLTRLGDLDLYTDDDGANAETIPIMDVKIHENYNSTSFINDIAILTLAHKPQHSGIWPICLPLAEPLRSNLFVKYNLLVAGWGSLYFNGPTSNSLQYVQLPVVSNDQCKHAFANFKTTLIDDKVICAGYVEGGKDSCKGDSGGPLMLGRIHDNQKFYYQLGVVSFGFRCAEAGYPGVYTRITSFIEWLTNNII